MQIVNGDSEVGFLTTVDNLACSRFTSVLKMTPIENMTHQEYCSISLVLAWTSTEADIRWCYFLHELKGTFLLSRESAYCIYPSVLRSLPAGDTILPAMLSAFLCRSFDNLFTTCDVYLTYALDDEVTASSYNSFLPFLVHGQVVLTAILNSYSINLRTKINCRKLW
jgi:hypothetical protein